MKKATMILLTLLICALPAFAESGVYAGEVVATEEVNVLAPCDGAIESYAVQAGAEIAQGEPVATYETEKVYATGDGTVAAVWAAEGEIIDGTLVEVEPIGKYTIYCSVDGGYETEGNDFVHAGETVYIKCTEDGTHRGAGVVTSVDGEEYMVATTGGAFYVGETVYLYRDADFTYAQRIGIGTLLYSDNTLYEADGTVIRLCVQAGERVERGQLLYETLGSAATEVTATATGIVASVGGAVESEAETSDVTDASQDEADSSDMTDALQSASTADQSSEVETTAQTSEATSVADNAVLEGDVLAVIYPRDAVMVEISVPEDSLSTISVGQSVEVAFADDPDVTYAGVVERLANIATDGAYKAQISVERDTLYIGMSCDVITN